MTDEKHLFVTDCADKKKTAYSSRFKVRGGGRNVKMPSDYLSKKERLMLNGEVKTYNLGVPMKWKEFRAMPDSIQVEYVESMRSKYNANATWLSEMFGVSLTSVIVWAKAHSVKFENCKPTHEMRQRFEAFVKGVRSEEPTEEKMIVETPKAEEAAEPPKEEPKKVTVNSQNIAVLLAMLAGSGAKLTIEVTL